MDVLFEQVCRLSTLQNAWKRVRAKKAAGDIDGLSVRDFERERDRFLRELLDELKNGTYVPEPFRRCAIPKMNGTPEKRVLSLPTVRDKIVQQAVRQVIEPLFEKVFLPCSYAYRPGKGPRKVFIRMHHLLSDEKYRWVALADFDNFFDSLNQDILINEVHKVVDDADILRLIRMWSTIGFVGPSGEYGDMPEGIGQGSIISPLLSNIYAHPLDVYMTRRGYTYLRYSDNMIVLSFSRKGAREALDDLTFYALETLKLMLNPDKRPICSLARGFTFLGIYYRDEIRAISTAKMAKIRRRIDWILRHHTSNPALLMTKLCESLAGFHRYYEVLDPEEQMVQTDLFVAERIIPLLAEFVRKGIYHTTRELTDYLSPLPFLSREFREGREERVKEIVTRSLKQVVTAKSTPSESRKHVSPSVEAPVKSGDRAVLRKKRKYLRKQALSSEIVVTTPGSFLGKRGTRVVVSFQGKALLKKRMETVQGILVAAHGITLSSDLVRACGEKGIPFLFCDALGTPYAMFLSPESPDTSLHLSQLEAVRNGVGNEIAKRIVAGKIKNQLNLMKFYGRSRKDNHLFQQKLRAMEDEVETMTDRIKRISDNDSAAFRYELLSIEGRVASSYWRLAKILFGNDMDFPGRERRGASDLINSCLNYGYGILYGKIWRALILARLNPYIGFLHASQKNKPVLVYDMIEEFRSQVVDRAIFTMVTRDEHLALDEKPGYLTDGSRKKVIQNVLERLSALVPYRRRRKVLLGEVIVLQSRHLARCLMGKTRYKPFVGRY